MLEATGLIAGYGDLVILRGLSLSLSAGEMVAVIGPNGAGKTTTLRTISGLLQPSSGQILLEGEDITGRPPHKLARMGLAHVPEGRGLLYELTVEENLRLVFESRPEGRTFQQGFDEVAAIFPILAERRGQRAVTLSGGEQQMVALAKGLMARPKVLLVDEPSLGLAPVLVERVYEALARINQAGVGVLIVEQHVDFMLEVASRVYVLRGGEVQLEAPSEELKSDPDVLARAYLGPERETEAARR